MNKTAEDLIKWADELPEATVPMYDLHSMILDGSTSYREYLKKIKEVSVYFCDNLGFVPGSTLPRIINNKMYDDALSGEQSTTVRTLSDGVRTIPNYVEDNDDDFM